MFSGTDGIIWKALRDIPCPNRSYSSYSKLPTPVESIYSCALVYFMLTST